MSKTRYALRSGQTARRVCAVIVLLLLSGTAITHVYLYFLARRIQAVISGLSKVQIDETTENELLRTVPYLIRNENDLNVRPNGELGNVDRGIERFYYANISTDEQRWMRFEIFADRFSRLRYAKDGAPRSWIIATAEFLGYRYIRFNATVVIFDGKVSSVRYGIANLLAFPTQSAEIVSVRSVHARWSPYAMSFYVPSADDETPQFQVKSDDRHLKVLFTSDVSPALRAHAFHVNLTCLWSLVGCGQASQIAPIVAQDKDATDAETLTRRQSNDPCPDRILAGRVRYLPDLEIFLLESMGFKDENQKGSEVRADEVWKHYKLIEVLRGRPSIVAETVGGNVSYPPYPGEYSRDLPKKGEWGARAGERVLVFSNFEFDSCQVVPATASALLVIRNAMVAPRRAEDEWVMGQM